MSVCIRMARHGRKKRPFYRIVAAHAEFARNGRYLEQLGTLDPLADPPAINLKEDRVKHWIGVGAKPSDTVANVVEKVIPGYLGDIEEKRKEKIRSRRAKRKARQKKSGK